MNLKELLDRVIDLGAILTQKTLCTLLMKMGRTCRY